MPNYKKLADIAAAPALAVAAARVLIVQDGVEYLAPLAALTDIDPAITSPGDLDALDPQPPEGAYKRFINPERDTLEFWRRDAGAWRQVL